MAMDDELRCLLEQMEARFGDRIDAEMRRIEQLRESDQLAVRVAYEGVRDRMEGFPQQYATRSEQEGIKDTAQRLEKDSISRELYDAAHNQLRADVSRKLESQVFESTLAEWVTWRRQVEQRLAAGSGLQHGVSRTIAWAFAGVAAIAAATGLVLNYN